ncbi:T9SS type A sorting domain-containing protein [Polluticoccus soli]|uniref:T9SS type A sorting domain-containing protein n=1 Tax=Polluticoccus soli TaxID=3034150 RepID=UPI0023E264AC|nr:T9SS type A sorting domain-containing protein [Flavipsychrobacter sp. JY13-12]
MKKPILSSLLCMVILCFQAITTKANYAAGGELLYEWTSGSTYRFYFKLYRDCGGITEPSTLPLCFSNSCNSSSFTTTLTKYPMTVPPYKFQCSQIQTKCDNPSSTIPGYQEVWYYADATLPFQCNSWRIFTYLATRNTSNNITNSSSTNMYVEVFFNNTGTFEGNSSSYYSVKPFINVCQNTPYAFNNGAVDPNADSLVTEVIQPLTGITSCSGAAAPVGFVSSIPALSIPTNPFQTGTSFTINAQTGQIGFSAAQAGVSALAIRTKEYRNGVFVSSIMREMPVNVYSCPSTWFPPALNLVGGTPPGGVYSTCIGQNLSFSFYFKTGSPTSRLYAMNAPFPGATVSYTNQGTDSVAGTFSWTPSANAAGPYNLFVTVHDSTCDVPGIIYSNMYIISVMAWNKVNAGVDTTLCLNATVDLKTNGIGQFTWTPISGDMNSLNCTTCAYPTAAPKTSSQYEVVVNGLPAGCAPQVDTIYVDIIPYNKPNVSIVASPSTNAWPGLNVTFTATPANCDTPSYQWRINGNDVPGATGSAFNTTTLANNDIVTCVLHCSDTCIIDTPSSAITMNIATGIHNTSANGLTIYPNPNNGSFTLALPVGRHSLKLEIVNTLGQVVWTQQRTRSTNAKTVEIETGTLPEGLYILKVGDNGTTDVLRFTIRR